MISVSAFIRDGNSEQQKTGNLGPRRLYTTSDWGRAGDDSNLMGGEYVSSSKRSGCFALSRCGTGRSATSSRDREYLTPVSRKIRRPGAKRAQMIETLRPWFSRAFLGTRA